MKRILTLVSLLFVLPGFSFAAEKVVVIPLFGSQGACPDGLTNCEGKCVDTLYNPRFCGDCNTSCNTDEYCEDGTCIMKCDDGNVCTDDIYDPQTGHCTFIPNAQSCDDGLYCNGTETCSAGVCGSSTGNPCPGPDGDNDCSESCNETDDSCTADDPGGSSCDDGLYCNGTEICSAGVCGSSTGDPCPGPDGDDNCSESCNETDDDCTANDPDGSICDDGIAMTTNDTCQSGVCVGE